MDNSSEEGMVVYPRRGWRLLSRRFSKGISDPNATSIGLSTMEERINCNVQPEIPDWADKKRPIFEHIPCGIIDPVTFATASIFQDGEDTLRGPEYIARAKGPQSLNACAFDFYAKEENWWYLPKKDDSPIVFPSTIFRAKGDVPYVRCLCREGLKWNRRRAWIVASFGYEFRVAVVANNLKRWRLSRLGFLWTQLFNFMPPLLR